MLFCRVVVGVINGAFHQTKETSGVSNQVVGKNLKKKMDRQFH